MNALILNGAPKGHPVLDQAAKLLGKELTTRKWDPVTFQLRDLSITACRGCFKCWMETPGQCHMTDDGNNLTKILAQSRLLVFLTPVSFGGYGSLLKTAMERAILPSLLPFMTKRKGETHHPLRYGHGISLIGVGKLAKKNPKSEKIFQNIVEANARNLDSPAQTCGFLYDDMSDKDIHGRMCLLAANAGGHDEDR
jgi:multimeric flavodoxin WrbA